MMLPIPHGLVPAPPRRTVSHDRRLRGLLIGLVAVSAIVVGADGASADCIGPTVSHDGGDLAHGDMVTVSGIGFGDSCYDTGAPPPGVGALGTPLDGIEVYLAQGDQLFLVATGTADEDYSWEIGVPIPAVLDAGEVDLVVMSRGSEAYEESSAEIWATSDRAEGSSIDVLTFGPVGQEEPAAAQPTAFQGTDWTPVILLASSTAAVAVVIAVRRRRQAR